jgi:PEP-CTERM motif
MAADAKTAVVHDPTNLCETSAELFIFRSRALCKVPSCKPLVFGMTHAKRNGIGMISLVVEERLMKLLTIATVVAMIALLPGYSHALAGKHRGRDAGPVTEQSVGSYAGSYAGPEAPVSVPEPGTFVLLASGLSTLGGLLAGRWYVTKKQAKRPERPEP